MRTQDRPERAVVPAPAHRKSQPAKPRFNALSLRLAAGRALDSWRENPFSALLSEQDRWFVWIPVCMSAGICAFFAVPSPPYQPALNFCAVALAIIAWRQRSSPLGLVLFGALAAFAAGFALAGTQANLSWAPSIRASTGAVIVTGRVEQVEKRTSGAMRYTLAVESVGRFSSAALPRRVTVTRRGETGDARPGDMVRVRAVLMPPPEPAAPGAFDFARRAYFQQIGGVGFAVSPFEQVPHAVSPGAIARLAARLQALRQRVAERITRVLPGQSGEIASALIVGKRGGIAEEPRQALRAAGLQHILAISGLHMALVAGTAFLAIRTLLAAIPGLALTRPVRKYAAAAALVIALAYLAVSGASVSAQRAFIMAATMFGAVLLDRPAITLRNVAIAALVIIAWNPFAVMQAGFQMSFAATAGLVSVYETIRRARMRAHGVGAHARDGGGPVSGILSRMKLVFVALVITALVGGLATAPFAAYHFNRIAPYGLLGNVLAMPLVSFIIMPAGVLSGLAFAFGLEALPLRVMGAGWTRCLPYRGGSRGCRTQTGRSPLSAR